MGAPGESEGLRPLKEGEKCGFGCSNDTRWGMRVLAVQDYTKQVDYKGNKPSHSVEEPKFEGFNID